MEGYASCNVLAALSMVLKSMLNEIITTPILPKLKPAPRTDDPLEDGLAAPHDPLFLVQVHLRPKSQSFPDNNPS